MTEGAPRRGRGFLRFARMAADRFSGAACDSKMAPTIRPPIPPGAETNWHVIAVRVHRSGQHTITIPCVGRKFTEKSEPLCAWLKELREQYPGCRLEVVT